MQNVILHRYVDPFPKRKVVLNRKLALLAAYAAFGLTSACADGLRPEPLHSTNTINIPVNRQSPFYAEDRRRLSAVKRRTPVVHAKNVILFVGDGMGISTITAARIRAGQLAGGNGEDHSLSFEAFPALGLIKTYEVNQQTADSAGTATAMITGAKTKAGMLSVAPDVELGDPLACTPQHALTTLFEVAEQAGLATGLVTTARLTHATPAAMYAHSPHRNWENDSQVPQGSNCRDIARQLVEFEPGDGLDVALGGGRAQFLPQTAGGKRLDGRDLEAQWGLRYGSDGQVVNDAETLKASAVTRSSHLLGLFAASHVPYVEDRPPTVPSLVDMTEAAISRLQANDKGFVLMVEAGRIDHAHHAGNAYRALAEAIELSAAVERALAMTDSADTLILVTADHSHTLMITGYPTRGNPILGKVVSNDAHGNPRTEPSLALDGKPYTTLSYVNGNGYAEHRSPDAEEEPEDEAILAASGRRLGLDIDTEAPDYHQEALVPLRAETHGGEDVAVFATGPGSAWIHGVQEQSYLFQAMATALGFELPEPLPANSTP